MEFAFTRREQPRMQNAETVDQSNLYITKPPDVQLGHQLHSPVLEGSFEIWKGLGLVDEALDVFFCL